MPRDCSRACVCACVCVLGGGGGGGKESTESLACMNRDGGRPAALSPPTAAATRHPPPAEATQHEQACVQARAQGVAAAQREGCVLVEKEEVGLGEGARRGPTRRPRDDARGTAASTRARAKEHEQQAVDMWEEVVVVWCVPAGVMV